MGTLPRSFYLRPTLVVAAELLGKVLVHSTDDGVTAGVIVEAEAYIGEEDPACHAAAGPTPRNQPLYGPPGFAYVYFNYGVHYLTNAVTEAEGSPAAVLLRALDPIDGLELMAVRRAAFDRRRSNAAGTAPRSLPGARHDLCRGPGNLSRAMGITLRQNRADLCASSLRIEDRGLDAGTVAWSTRIGISVGTERRWRCFIAGHPAVSGPRAPVFRYVPAGP
ncbi:MAG: DNA-3-methyladenine glycosylase [Vicinamibacterales bacterium]